MLKNLTLLIFGILGLVWVFTSMYTLDQSDKRERGYIETIKSKSDYMVFMFDMQMAEKKRADFVVGRLVRSWHDMNKFKTGKYLSDQSVVYSLNKLYAEMGE